MNEVNLRRRDDDKVLFTRSTLPPALGYAPYLLALSPLTLPDLDYLSADRYQIIHKMIREGTIGLSRQSSEYPPSCIVVYWE